VREHEISFKILLEELLITPLPPAAPCICCGQSGIVW